MSYICAKALTLGGMPYYPGDLIPDDAVLPSRVRALKTSGYITDVAADSAEWAEMPVATGVLEAEGYDGKVVIPIIKDIDGETAEALAVPLTEGEVQMVFAIMQMTVDQAEEEIEKITEEGVLIVLHAADTRAGIKKAAQKRAATLSYTEQKKNEATGGNETIEGNNGMDTQPE